MITTQKALRAHFWESFPEFQSSYRVKKRQNDYNATIRTAWCMFLDSVRKDGQISEKLSNRATL